jgi:hypothetical protein
MRMSAATDLMGMPVEILVNIIQQTVFACDLLDGLQLRLINRE